MTLLIIVLLILILLALVWLLARLPLPFAPPGLPGPPGPPGAPSIPDRFDEPALAAELSLRVAGFPADGSLLTVAQGVPAVIWADAGDEVLVHLDSLKTRMLDGMLLVSVDLETDQTGRSSLVVPFALTHDPNDLAGLIATTEEYPRGLGALAARWGRTLQAALWAGLLSIAQDHATQRSSAPRTIVINRGTLHLEAGPPLKAAAQPRQTGQASKPERTE
jgi:hypothetical protein